MDADDLVTATQPDRESGLRVRTVSSGDFAQLQQAWGTDAVAGGEMAFVRSRFLMLALPPRGLPR